MKPRIYVICFMLKNNEEYFLLQFGFHRKSIDIHLINSGIFKVRLTFKEYICNRSSEFNIMQEKVRTFIETNAFGVCAYLGEKFDIASSKIRLYFIYLSFFTFGSPVIIYLFIAFWMNVKRYILFSKRNPLRYR